MFNKRRIDMKSLRLPTSKSAAKMQCLITCNGDIDKAEKLYEFLTKDIELPDFEPIAPIMFQKVQNTAGDMLGWVKENQDTILQITDFIKSLRGAKIAPAIPPTPLPIINK